ncbi:MAG: methylated-DNA--[protein]-cysteine S-methyltransferase, partial [Gammaproteobacteria bacterium]|nr:methylated-DNA--[protein]-cysteine S-methyltransferase [Gammaproteobacteria bacterium]
MTMPSEQAMRAAITSRDKTSDGKFFYGVITTGVFCKPSCTTRAARPENLRFFAGTEAAIVAGFRSCKRCQPAADTPAVKRLVEVARYIESHADERLTLAQIAAQAGLSASRLQRIFKQAFGMSPKAFQDAVRLKQFKSSLQQGDSVTDAIFSSGFGSTSRVYGEAARNIGMTPKAYRAGGAGEVISYACRDTALGTMTMAATKKGVCFVQFGEDDKSLLAQLKAEFPKARLTESGAQNTVELDSWIDALDKHISTAAPRPDLPIDLRGTAFQMQVWRFLTSIDEGKVLTYSELAAQIDKPKAIRAVASACAANR